MPTWYIHRFDVNQEFGGPEEGGWWYDQQTPISPQSWRYMEPLEVVGTEDKAFSICARYNQAEGRRRKAENKYGFTSVLSYRDRFYAYDVSERYDARPHPMSRPHYE